MNWTKATIQELCAVIMGGEATEEEYEAAGAELMNELEEIWESWDYHLEEALIRADQIVRLMFKEAKMFRVP